ncbi:ASCH domain-containing protein [Taibaiella koreensis]|uniref:ASCH domain-containing protein n=1 Tax=Taibaiella koreensis TaxID=1268548 RepID=UPI000E59D2FF|nr:ASCH domain-containing protein [Taibaiella koreensis]
MQMTILWLFFKPPETAIVPFDEVTTAFAYDCGEEDRSLESWRRIYHDYIETECRRMNRMPSEQMPIVCERFRVVYREPLQTLMP